MEGIFLSLCSMAYSDFLGRGNLMALATATSSYTPPNGEERCGGDSILLFSEHNPFSAETRAPNPHYLRLLIESLTKVKENPFHGLENMHRSLLLYTC